MKMLKSYLFKLADPYGWLHISEVEDGQGVEFICEGNFILNKEEAAKIAQLIDPFSYTRERIRYEIELDDVEPEDESV